MAMLIYRLEDLSVYYFIKDVIFSGISGIRIEDSYVDEVLSVPTVAIDAGKLKEELFEMGNRDKVRIRVWYIDIYARNRPQADDFGYRILAGTKNGINIYDYNDGFPPTVAPSKIGHMQILSDSYEPVPVMLDEVEPNYYRGQVILVTQNDTV